MHPSNSGGDLFYAYVRTLPYETNARHLDLPCNHNTTTTTPVRIAIATLPLPALRKAQTTTHYSGRVIPVFA